MKYTTNRILRILYDILPCLCIILVSSKLTTFVLTITDDKDYIINNHIVNTINESGISKGSNFTIEREEISLYDEDVIQFQNYIGENKSNNLNTIEPMVLVKDEYRMEIDDETYEVLLRVVEAEVTGSGYRYKGNNVSEEEMLLSKIRVAQVFMNRVEDESKFSRITNLYDALTEKGATSTLLNGRYYEVTVCDLTKEAIRLALLKDTPDYTDGALFFNSCSTTIKYGDYLFTDNVGHHFFK